MPATVVASRNLGKPSLFHCKVIMSCSVVGVDSKTPFEIGGSNMGARDSTGNDAIAFVRPTLDVGVAVGQTASADGIKKVQNYY
jgi:hypothetical protein